MHSFGVGHTHVGRVREKNEDDLLVDNGLGLFIVSDGMGGHAAGEVASATAVARAAEVVRQSLGELDQPGLGRVSTGELARLARFAVEEASREVYHKAKADSSLRGMGCTMTLLLTVGGHGVMAHVGDSRLYLFRGDETHQLSQDHTIASELMRAGMLSPEEAERSPQSHVLSRSLGLTELVQVDTLVIDIVPGDRLMLCSDGLGKHVVDLAWLHDTCMHEDFEAIPEELISFANAAGGEDNITALVVQVEADAPEQHTVPALRTDVYLKLRTLGSVFLFDDLTLAQLARVLDLCTIDGFERGQDVIRAGDICSRLSVVMSGRFDLIRNGDKVGELEPGQHVGADTLLHARPARATLRAAATSRLLTLDADGFRKLIRLRPYLGVALLERLALRLSRDLERSGEFVAESYVDDEESSIDASDVF